MGKKKLRSLKKKNLQNLRTRNMRLAQNNGTSALDALLSAFNITNKDEVLVPSLTYVSTANVVMYKKMQKLDYDSDNKIFNTNKDFLESITNKTKLIIVTDMKGMPVDYDLIKNIFQKKNSNYR